MMSEEFRDVNSPLRAWVCFGPTIGVFVKLRPIAKAARPAFPTPPLQAFSTEAGPRTERELGGKEDTLTQWLVLVARRQPRIGGWW